MYKIIGTDGRQYGPVSVEQIRQWLAQSRVNAQTMAQAQGSYEWKPLSSFPELADEFKAAPPAAPGAYSNPRASNKIAAGICGILLGSLGVHKFILGYTGAGLIMLLVSILAPVLTCFTFGFLATGVMGIIGLIEGIIYLCKSDDDFVRTYVDGRREWF
ncbi:MAG TPA: GYF domain-containing protein [Candidatus Acidoferrum sp.]|nr:GYF domain-containing protein [Candidatus Acidoferrum sp.]